MRNSTFTKKYLYYILGVLFIFICWFLYSLYADNSLIVPTPFKVFKEVGNLLIESNTYMIILNSLYRLIISFILSTIIGITLGLIAGLFKRFEYFLRPLMTTLRSLPLASIIIIIMIVVGIVNSPLIITMIMLIPLIYQNVCDGVRQIDQEQMEYWRLDSKLNLKIIFKVILPSIKSNIRTALVEGIGLGIKVLIMAEFLCYTKTSIGVELVSAKNNILYVNVYAWSFILIVIVLLSDLLIRLILKDEKKKLC